ncbi:MAG: DUF1738 domain-containing protein, partial [Rhodospirillaceae bacterium]|nr:DUF1738 domain-containing protein [Rhodospirillaceae bacterium]
MAEDRVNYRNEVVQEIIQRIEAGTAPWQKPWKPNELGARPFNPTSGKPYRGINDIVLSLKDYSDPRWMTFRQASDLDLKIRKGSKATTIEYWQWSERVARVDASGKPVLDAEGLQRYDDMRLDRPRVFYAKVFNGTQIDGLEPWVAPAPSFNPVERAEVLIDRAGVPVIYDQRDRAFYSPWADEIHLNPRSDFKDAPAFYETILHELGHATGHETRLGRDFGPKGSEGYAREELRAEIASYMLARDLGIGFDPSNHAAYVENWLKALKEDKNEIFHAARDAETIKTWVMEPEQRQALEQTAQARNAASQTEERAMTETPVARVYLSVPFAERGAAKKAGAKFDSEAKRWFVPEGADPATFVQWAEQIEQAPTVPDKTAKATEPAPSKEPLARTYLAVPYAEKDAAKAAGARFDSETKAWYVPEGANLASFSKWAAKPEQEKAPSKTITSKAIPEKEGMHFIGWHTPRAIGTDDAVSLQSSGLPCGKFIALDRPFSSDIHDPRQAIAVEVNLSKVYDPDGLLDPGNRSRDAAVAEGTIAAMTEAMKTLRFDTQKGLAAFLTEQSMARTNYIQSHGYDGYVRGIDGDITDRELIVFNRALVTERDLSETQDRADLSMPYAEKEAVSSEQGRSARTYLAVPYAEKDAAKAAGAKWDRKAKAWYAPEGTDMAVFAKWTAVEASVASTPEVSPRDEFAKFAESHGLRLPDAPIMDGKWHRVAVDGDRKGQFSGSYRGFLDGRPSGQVTNYKGGENAVQWVATGVALTDEQRAQNQAEATQVRERREAERLQAAEAAARKAYGVWQNLPAEATRQNCSYLERKDVHGHGVKVDKDGNMVVPQRDETGRLWGVQFCRDDGKRYIKDSRKIGTMHVIEPSGKGTLDAITPAMGGTIVIAEGYATAATIHEATG